MAKVIAVIGTHGSGKSTLLQSLKEKLPSVIVDDFKVSRTLQSELGIKNLIEIIKSPASIESFQEKVLARKLEHDTNLQAVHPENGVVLVERSFYDILAYTQLWLNQFDRLSPDTKAWFKDYSSRVVEAQGIYDGHIMVHANKDIPFEVDPNRASLATRAAMEQLLISYDAAYSSRFTRPDPSYAYHKLNIFASDINARVNAVEELINSLQV